MLEGWSQEEMGRVFVGGRKLGTQGCRVQKQSGERKGKMREGGQGSEAVEGRNSRVNQVGSGGGSRGPTACLSLCSALL